MLKFKNDTSRPSRARGLKRVALAQRRHAAKVAPLAGAWIETAPAAIPARRAQSRPSRARGLKLVEHRREDGQPGVAPLAGAWIETP